MAITYICRPTGGNYFNSSGTSAAAGNHYYYASNRSFRMDFPDFATLLGKPKNHITVKSAILHVHKTNAYAATLTMGYNYATGYANRKSLYAARTGISMGKTTGGMDIDLTSVIQAYVKDGVTGAMRLWAYGTGGSTSYSAIRGYSPGSKYNAQRPYLTLVYEESNARIYSGGEWKTASPYIYTNGQWVPVSLQLFDGTSWK